MVQQSGNHLWPVSLLLEASRGEKEMQAHELAVTHEIVYLVALAGFLMLLILILSVYVQPSYFQPVIPVSEGITSRHETRTRNGRSSQRARA